MNLHGGSTLSTGIMLPGRYFGVNCNVNDMVNVINTRMAQVFSELIEESAGGCFTS